MTREEKSALKMRRATAAEDRLNHLMLRARHEGTQLNAAVRLHALLNGTSIARTKAATDAINAMSADEIRAELARLESEATAD